MAEGVLQRIVDGGLCAGCGACVSAVGGGALQMRIDRLGFLRPSELRELTASEAQTVRDICPGLELRHEPAHAGSPGYHRVWGPIVSVAAGWAVDASLRHRASSGGALSALLIHLLESRQVDFVVHTRVAEDDPLRNDAVISTTRDEIAAGAGSRYAPAAPVAALSEALARPGRFAFLGKPCDVAAVRKMIHQQPSLAERIPFLLSFMCAGTPSLQGSLEILERLNVGAGELRSFRYRGEGWPGLTRAETKAGRIASMDYDTAWGSILNRHLQTRCKLCADGTGEFADVVGADAWYSADGKPDFQERNGRSLLLVRTKRGEEIVRAAAGALSLEPFDIATLQAIQPYQFNRKTLLPMRLLAMKLTGKAVPKYRGFGMLKSMLRRSPIRLAREFTGALIRSIKGRL